MLHFLKEWVRSTNPGPRQYVEAKDPEAAPFIMGSGWGEGPIINWNCSTSDRVRIVLGLAITLAMVLFVILSW